MESVGTILPIIISIIIGSTPLLLAASGELVVERSGVLNLGIEGMMLMGAVVAFITALTTDSSVLAVFAAALAGAGLSLVFAVITQHFKANQIVAGLALTIFGIGLSALTGKNFVGQTFRGIPELPIPFLRDIPIIGDLFFNHNFLVYLSFIIPFAVGYFLYHTRSGLILRVIGEDHDSAHLMGYKVIKVRYLAILFGGALAGLAGASLSVALIPHWAEGMAAGKGWIALALVVFATWRPYRLMIGAYLFGGIMIGQFHAQGLNLNIDPHFFNILPYLVTIITLVFVSMKMDARSLQAPGSLGTVFYKN